jgi:hypothetical protein
MFTKHNDDDDDDDDNGTTLVMVMMNSRNVFLQSAEIRICKTVLQGVLLG